ncbi:M20/M25/M40 family metallo-hydrolase [Eudoraea chungangensis]|uniref:M20/M25/M40 family metallo-hydrolase n=1 Tax=Eudoraea chungangensis TaxID=1481905 RepID=UPI0023EC1A74|nr:M20/M25/M40 family metallo-hydrolase [Eudoraea chungangensis]
MKKYPSIISFLLILLAIIISFEESMPSYEPDINASETEFSAERAFKHVVEISKEPHGIGFPGHEKVTNYLVAELKKLELETDIQFDYNVGDEGNLSKPKNIISRIKGVNSNGKALLLLSHYDSSPHSSYGASDAGSGVATILEGLRAFFSKGIKPKNDIIVLFTDGEELGLNGAELFVNHHPWANDIGLVLNFEARGSGGPSIMLMETNRANGTLIKEFKKADPDFPVANSLAYSVYKILPNDMDTTVFREDMDIEAFNFAFIDDHYDYHTAQDNALRLNKNTLAHQGSYLMPLLSYFSQSDLSNLKSLEDYIYFNLPYYKLVIYPFDWIWPLFFISLTAFLICVFLGFRRKELKIKEILLGFIPPILVVGINGFIGFYSWRILKWLYPQYEDILHGFTYNGHTYILAFVLLSIAVCFWIYNKFRKITRPNLMVAPIILWFIINGMVAQYLPGASYFIIPLIGFLGSFVLCLDKKTVSPLLLVFLAIPGIWIYAPLIELFPIGLGLKLLIAATLLTSLSMLLLLPIFYGFKAKGKISYFLVLLSFGFFISAHFTANFNEDRKRPSSLLYVVNLNQNKANWTTYDKNMGPWASQFFSENGESPTGILSSSIISSKYNSGFNVVAPAELKDIQAPLVTVTKDTTIGQERVLELSIIPQRNVNRLDIFTNNVPISKGTVNGAQLPEYFLSKREGGKLLTHFIRDNDQTDLSLYLPLDVPLELTFMEASNDLLYHPLFSLPPRPKDEMPMPFVLNDAVVLFKTLQL